MKNSILEIKNLNIINAISGSKLLHNVSFSVEEGRITGVAGESGSGKSVTALSITGLLPPSLQITKGEALYQKNGKIIDLFQLKKNEINKIRGKEISMIFQEPMTSLNPSMRCGRQVSEAIQIHENLNKKEAGIRVRDIFKLTGLPDPERIYRSYPHQLSGGQRQRIMIAMAIITKPKVLIADEPTTALDVRVQKNILELISRLQQEMHLSVIFISHDLRLLDDICDHVVIMRNGRVIESGLKTALFNSPSTSYTRGLLKCLPPVNDKPARLLTIEDLEAMDEPNSENPEKTIKNIKNNLPNQNYKKQVLLEVNNLNVSYFTGKNFFSFSKTASKAVDNISFHLFKGETLGLVGESGCGKTTLGKTILGLIKPGSGDIIFNNVNLNKLNRGDLKKFRKNVQVVFQDPYSSLNPRIRIGTLLSEVRKINFPSETRAVRKEVVSDLIIKTGLENQDLEKYPHEFSGGQRQRIGIARALLTEPELLVLDESVSALDVSVQARILNLLNDIKDEFDLSYIFISHDLSVVRYMSDRIMIMKEGRLVEETPAKDLYHHYRNEYTRELINSIPGYRKSPGSS